MSNIVHGNGDWHWQKQETAQHNTAYRDTHRVKQQIPAADGDFSPTISVTYSEYNLFCFFFSHFCRENCIEEFSILDHGTAKCYIHTNTKGALYAMALGMETFVIGLHMHCQIQFGSFYKSWHWRMDFIVKIAQNSDWNKIVVHPCFHSFYTLSLFVATLRNQRFTDTLSLKCLTTILRCQYYSYAWQLLPRWIKWTIERHAKYLTATMSAKSCSRSHTRSTICAYYLYKKKTNPIETLLFTYFSRDLYITADCTSQSIRMSLVFVCEIPNALSAASAGWIGSFTHRPQQKITRVHSIRN